MQISLPIDNQKLEIESPPLPQAILRICSLDDLPVGLGRAFTIAGRTLAIFRTRKGSIFAIDNRCPHKGGPLAEGMLAGDTLVCPLHAFRYEMSTGECDQPNACAVKTYPVEVRDNDIFLSSESTL